MRTLSSLDRKKLKLNHLRFWMLNKTIFSELPAGQVIQGHVSHLPVPAQEVARLAVDVQDRQLLVTLDSRSGDQEIKSNDIQRSGDQKQWHPEIRRRRVKEIMMITLNTYSRHFFLGFLASGGSLYLHNKGTKQRSRNKGMKHVQKLF